jgi:hypothetical protein
MSQPNNGLNAGPISANDLMAKLAKASKVMQKVQDGDFSRGNVNESMLSDGYDDNGGYTQQQMPQQQMQQQQTPQQYNTPDFDVSKIQNSKLPDAIKKAMMENPISQISLGETLDMDFVKGAKRLIEQENRANNPSKSNQQSKPVQNVGGNIDMNAIAVLIENTVRKVMDEKLNQILTASTTSSINENLVLKVGDSIFKGKITGVNKSK